MRSVRFGSFRFLKCRFIPGLVQASVRVGWKELAVRCGLRFVSNLQYSVLFPTMPFFRFVRIETRFRTYSLQTAALQILRGIKKSYFWSLRWQYHYEVKGYNKVSAGDVVRSHRKAARGHKHVLWRLTEDSMGHKPA